MRVCLVFLILSFHTTSAQFFDDFSGNEINPAWGGNISDFIIEDEQLRLQAEPIASESYISAPSSAIYNATWELKISLGFNPSSANYCDFYLISDNNDLTGNVEGYLVRIGGSDDEVSLFRKDGTTTTKIIDGEDGILNSGSVEIWVKVTRNANGSWELLRKLPGDPEFIFEGEIVDENYLSGQYSGISCTYTATRSDQFWFDDLVITGEIIPDEEPPFATGITVEDQQSVTLYFSEPLEVITAEDPTLYYLSPSPGVPSSAMLLDSESVLLQWPFPFENGTYYTLSFSGINDTAGNASLAQELEFLYFIPSEIHYRDIVFNELMPDPTPPVGLPEVEFIEILNSSTNFINLEGWSLVNTETATIFPEYILGPGDFLLVCEKNDSLLLSPFGETLGLSPFSALSNAADSLTLLDNEGNVVDIVSYNTEWYNDNMKDDGGWTLELINPYAPCSDSQNWTASMDESGGTPGKENSTFNEVPDPNPPAILNLVVEDHQTIILEFDKQLDSAETGTAIFLFEPELELSEIVLLSQGKKMKLSLADSLLKGIIYQMHFSGVSDCEGNLAELSGYKFGLPVSGKPDDIIINELLFDPKTGGQDFVELYNRSANVISLENWKIARNDEEGVEISSGQKQFLPGNFLVLTADPESIVRDYPFGKKDSYFLVAGFPNFVIDGGTVRIYNEEGMVINEMIYDDDFHFPLLNSTKGVSLERINYDPPADNSSNWTSASETVGFATPGYQNSQYIPPGTPSGNFTLVPEIFSPDNDGMDDVLLLRYQMNEPNYHGTFHILDVKGRIIRQLARNYSLGSNGQLMWDGLTDKGEKAPVGVYVVSIEIFNDRGNTRNYKEVAVLAAKFRN